MPGDACSGGRRCPSRLRSWQRFVRRSRNGRREAAPALVGLWGCGVTRPSPGPNLGLPSWAVGRKGAYAAMTGTWIAALNPAVIHWTLGDSNAFLFGAATVAVATLPILLLSLWARRRVGFDGLPSLGDFLPSSTFWRLAFRPAPSGLDVVVGGWGDLRRMPAVWLVAANFNFALFALATQFTETAVVAAIAELWPALVVFGVARIEAADLRFCGLPPPRRSGAALWTAMLIAGAAGLMLLALAQTSSEQPWSEVLTGRGMIGMGIALCAAVCSGAHITCSLMLGKLVYYQVAGQAALPVEERRRADDEHNSTGHATAVLWLTLLVTALHRLMTLPVQAFGALMQPSGVRLSPTALAGAAALGVLGFVCIVFRRLANIAESPPEINALGFAVPPIGIAILAVYGIEIERFGVFLAGAALLFAVSVVVQTAGR